MDRAATTAGVAPEPSPPASPASGPQSQWPVRLCLGLILVGAVALGWLYATRIPKWNAPDEPAHFNYVRHVAESGSLPTLQVGDYDFQKVEERMAARFPDRLPVDWMRYESHQPPLYYVLAAPVYLLTVGQPIADQVLALRMFSTFLGALGLIVAYLIVRALFPGDAVLALAVPAVIAFVPMRVAMYAAVENDALAELVMSAVLLALVVGLRRRSGWRYDSLVGVLLAAALLTKVVDYAAAAIVVAAYVIVELAPAPDGRAAAERLRRLVGRLAVTYGVAAVLSGWWFVRNAVVYGWPDFFGLRRHALVVVGQPLTGPLTRQAIQHFLATSFNSFWAQFGWMGVTVDERIYLLLLALCAVAGFGLLLYAGRIAVAREPIAAYQRRGLVLVALCTLLVAGGVVAYNLTYLQTQGRYFFPALASLALLFVLGVRELLSREHENLLLGLLAAGLFGLSLLCLFQYVVPAFAG